MTHFLRPACFIFLIFTLSTLLSSCVRTPEGIEPVENFDVERYLGRWYEIARLDNRFERGLSNITAEYSLREGGGINVLNRGFNIEKGEWKDAEGKAYFVEREDIGYLKVSFFGPFYGAYVVFELDQNNYEYAMISGPDRSYFWLLARSPTLAPEWQQALIAKAASRGFETDKLIFVEHDRAAQ